MEDPKTIETVYGTVDAVVLSEIRGRFPTSDLLKAAEAVEAQRLWLRDSLVRLHRMAHHLLDSAPATLTAQEPVWQLAEEIADQLDASAAAFGDARRLVDRLARLRPHAR
jgi:hypothetical protein